MPSVKVKAKSFSFQGVIKEAQRKYGMSANAAEVFVRRYVRKGPDGNPSERAEDTFWRVAGAIAEPDKIYGEDFEATRKIFYDLLSNFLFVPNSPTWTGAGTPLGQLAACFVLPIKDDLGRDPQGIFSTLRVAALIQQTGGGNGFSFSRLRPRGDFVYRSGGKSTGPLGFLKAYDAAFGVIAQGGVRRGANMAVLRVDHPDIRAFIHCKEKEGEITNFNISVAATDEFMRAVEEGKKFALRNPKDGKVLEEVDARLLFDEHIRFAHHNGEPGVLFIDAANRDNPVPHLYQLEATNPCVTGDTLVYTEDGLRRVDELAALGMQCRVVTDGRLGGESLKPASPIFPTGVKDVFRLITKEGYELRLTSDHKVMTERRGWIESSNLKKGEKVFLLNRRGSFGHFGSLGAGRVLGWLVGDGTLNAIRGVLSFFGEEKKVLAPVFAEMVTSLFEGGSSPRLYPVGVTEVEERDEWRVSSERLTAWAAGFGLGAKDKHKVPAAVLSGNEEMQKGFLQALFTADGYVNDGGEKGCSVRLSSSHLPLLKNVQRLLLNFAIASKIYEDRRKEGFRLMPDGRGGRKEYFSKAQHELIICKSNLVNFSKEIGFLTEAKQAKLLGYLSRMKRGPYRETFLATVKDLVPDGREMVFDLQEPETHSFVANGLVVHNCGEQWLGPYENCCLGSVNLARHLTREGKIDWGKLAQTVRASTFFLDNVVDANKYVPEVPELQEAAHRARRIGLGIMGLADVMYVLGIRYGSREGIDAASQIMEFVQYYTMLSSVERAKNRGPFPAMAGSIYDQKRISWGPKRPLYRHKLDLGRPKIFWRNVLEGIKKYGIRNGAHDVIAPTGTIATVADCEGYGCEPVFALAYTRRLFQAAGEEGRKVELRYTSPLFERALKRAGVEEKVREDIYAQVLENGSCQQISRVPAKIREVYAVSSDITPDEHIEIQAALQRFIDNSISKTCNFPASATEEDVKTAYFKAWKLGCKGLTVYVTGTRKEVVLETEETKKRKEAEGTDIFIKPRPHAVRGATYRVDTPVGTAFVTVNENGGGNPLEVFVNVGKAGSDITADAEAIGRLSSLILRIDPTMNPKMRVEAIVDQLSGIGGSRAVGFGKERVRSLVDGIAHVLAEYLGDIEVRKKEEEQQLSLGVGKLEKIEPVADLCPECGQATFVFEEGCRKCHSCGFSEC